ncbi:MAG: hypothetical protein LBV33_02120 [Lachnospiraceae bacterium]|nr:hypothetical protein [Lachnospiraceae bacterium]
MEFSNHEHARADDRILAFDTLFTTNQIQKLKILIPFMDNQMQKQMAVFIKFMELQYTISFFERHPYRLCGCFEQESTGDFRRIYNALKPYSDAAERRQMDRFMSIFQAMDTYREMSQMMELMKEIMPDMGGGDFGNFGDLSSLAGLGGMGGMGDLLSSLGGLGGFGGMGGNHHDEHHRDEHDHDERHHSDNPHDERHHNDHHNDERYHGDSQHDGRHHNDNHNGERYHNDHQHDERYHGDSQHDEHHHDGGAHDQSGGMNMMNMLKSMLTPEQLQMFELIGGNQNE